MWSNINHNGQKCVHHAFCFPHGCPQIFIGNVLPSIATCLNCNLTFIQIRPTCLNLCPTSHYNSPYSREKKFFQKKVVSRKAPFDQWGEVGV